MIRMINDVKNIKIGDFSYTLPDEKIAKFPLVERDSSKLLVYRHGQVSEDLFHSLPNYLSSGALMIFNNTKVIQARLHFHKDVAENSKSLGALIEIFLLEPAIPNDYQLIFSQTERCSWYCLVGNLKRWKEGTLKQNITIGGHQITLTAERGEIHGTSHQINFSWNDSSLSFAEILDAIGEIPIPPYLNRESQESDKTTYQTVYSKIKGSVAAPTAGLHFTDKVLADIDAHGIDREELTLHVGAGTFNPVKSEEIEGHEMHTEYICVNKKTIDKLIAHGGKAIAVGTTSVRTLESLYYMGVKLHDNPNLTEEQLHVGQWEPYDYAERLAAEGTAPLDTIDALREISDYLDRNSRKALHSSTQIIIAPGFEYHIVDILVTNFHQPQSTLLLLVSAFVKGEWRRIYDYALAHDFRFLSYGDSCLIKN